MMSAAFAALGLPHRYAIADVAPADLPAAVAAPARADAGGANVTTPHKAAVAQPGRRHLARRRSRPDAVNCVVRDGDRLVGHNTDLPAIIDELRALATRPASAGSCCWVPAVPSAPWSSP